MILFVGDFGGSNRVFWHVFEVCPWVVLIVGRGCVELIGVIAHVFSFWFIIAH